MSHSTRIAVIGHGEAGSLIAGGLLTAGADVIGFDPANPEHPTTPMASTVAEAITGADVILSINSSTLAHRIAEEIAGLIRDDDVAPGAIYADLNTGTPAMKRHLAELFPDGQFADVAIMRPVPGRAEKVPLLVAGSGGERFVGLLGDYAPNMEFVSNTAGDAAARKLIRSILAKGIAGVVIDTLWAAESMGLEEWAYREILNEFNEMNDATAQRYLDGTAVHFKRRQIEMTDIVDMLSQTGYESTMLAPVQFNYGRIMHGKQIPFAKKKKR